MNGRHDKKETFSTFQPDVYEYEFRSDQIRLKFLLFQSVFCNGSRIHSQKSSPLFTIHQSKHVNAFAILDDSDDESPKAAAAPPAKKDTKPKTQAVSNGNKEKR